MKKFAVVLSGCGVFDGAEIHEAVFTFWAIKKHGADYQSFAPNVDQYHVVNHMTGDEMPEKRNVLVESARIVRGEIKDLKEFRIDDFDGIIFPGGFGAAKNLCDFAFKGENMSVLPEVEEVILQTIKAEKPIGAECISPVIMAKVLEDATVTIGTDESTAKAIEIMGGTNMAMNHKSVCYDPKHKLYTTPCYMMAGDILQVSESAEAIVEAMLKQVRC